MLFMYHLLLVHDYVAIHVKAPKIGVICFAVDVQFHYFKWR